MKSGLIFLSRAGLLLLLLIVTLILASISPWYHRGTITEPSQLPLVQSHVSAHSELTWLLTCCTPLNWLERMIQFKEKKVKQVGPSNEYVSGVAIGAAPRAPVFSTFCQSLPIWHRALAGRCFYIREFLNAVSAGGERRGRTDDVSCTHGRGYFALQTRPCPDRRGPKAAPRAHPRPCAKVSSELRKVLTLLYAAHAMLPMPYGYNNLVCGVLADERQTDSVIN